MIFSGYPGRSSCACALVIFLTENNQTEQVHSSTMNNLEVPIVRVTLQTFPLPEGERKQKHMILSTFWLTHKNLLFHLPFCNVYNIAYMCMY